MSEPTEPKMVHLEKKEYSVVNDGKGLRMRVALMLDKTYSKEGLVVKKVQLENELEEVSRLLAECDKLNII